MFGNAAFILGRFYGAGARLLQGTGTLWVAVVGNGPSCPSPGLASHEQSCWNKPRGCSCVRENPPCSQLMQWLLYSLSPCLQSWVTALPCWHLHIATAAIRTRHRCLNHLGMAGLGLYGCAKPALRFQISWELLKFCSDLFKGTYVAKVWEMFKTEFGIGFECFSCHLWAEMVDGILQAMDKQHFWCTAQSGFAIP